MRTTPLRAALVAVIATGAALVAAPPAAAFNCAAFKSHVQNAHNGDVITLDAGLTCNDTYVLPADRSAPFSFTIQGGGGGGTLDGTGRATRIMTGEPAAGKQLHVTIRNLSFRNGAAPAAGSGGALRLAGGDVSATLERDRFVANAAPTGLGGAVELESSGTSRTIAVTDSSFGDGSATHANSAQSGGALEIISSGSGPSVLVQRNQFDRNSSSQTSGAFEFVVNGSGSTATLTDNLFAHSTAHGSAGGAVSGGTNSVVMRRNRFLLNTLASTSNFTSGGGIVLTGDSAATLDQSGNRFDRNRITRGSQTDFEAGGGGEWIDGFFVKSRGDRFIKNSIPAASGTGSAEGGGLGIEGCPALPTPLTVRMVNDSAAGNTGGAGTHGAGVYMGGCSSGPLVATILDTTIAGNSTSGAGATAGLAGGGDDKLTMRNSIVAGNTGAPNLTGFGASLNVAYSDACGPAVLPGAGNVCVKPRLRGPAHGDVHLRPLSPLIDAGRNADVPAAIHTDFENDSRILLQRVDIGADEYRDPFLGVLVPKQTVTVKNGTAKVLVSCPANIKGPCAGDLKLVRSGSGLGHKSFSIARGTQVRVAVKLNDSALSQLDGLGTLECTGKTTAVDGFGTSRTRSGKVTLKKG